MPVNRVKRSLAAQAVAETALAKVLPLLGCDAANCTAPGRLEMIPIYSISARNIVAGRWNKGWRSGWRYLWSHDELELGIVVEVRRGSDDAPHLASVSIGGAAKAMSRELADASKRLARSRLRYRPRLLRLPWIGMEAIWLNTDSLGIPDRFINRAGEPHGAAFRSLAVKRARAILKERADKVHKAD